MLRESLDQAKQTLNDIQTTVQDMDRMVKTDLADLNSSWVEKFAALTQIQEEISILKKAVSGKSVETLDKSSSKSKI